MKTVVMGAGPAGVTAAHQLAKETTDVTVFEAAECVGGLARSIQLWGQTVDLGPHRFFSKDRLVNELWLEVVGRDYSMVQRQTRILYKDTTFKYPLEAFDALGKLGPVEAALCVGSYLFQKSGARSQKPEPRNERTGNNTSSGFATSSPSNAEKDGGSFEDWVCRRFGRRLFETFFKTYSEKLWGIPCTELDADFAAQRIKQFSLSAAIKSALFTRNKKKHRTLVDEFAYPLGGTGMVYERMADAIRQRGGQVHLNAPARKVLVERGRVVGVAFSRMVGTSHCDVPARAPMGGTVAPLHAARTAQRAIPTNVERMACDHVISTMPLTTLLMTLDDVPPEVVNAGRQLKFRNTILVYLEVLNENPFPDNWIYVHSPELQFGRVTNFRNWVPQLYGESKNAILALEYWCNADDEMWKRDETSLIAQAQSDIVKSSLVNDPAKLGRGFVFRIPKCYPVYRRGYQEHVRLIKDYLSTISGLQVIGRYGSFKYNNQDHSILMGLLAAENVLAEKQHDLWGVNADYETYQEECSIAETGLVTA
jgi:protoporphyrinogen oxidase